MTLTEFLLARIAEDEAVAQDAAKYLRPGDYIDITLSMYDQESGESHSKRIRPWQPERVLAECEAKCRIVEQAEEATADHEAVALDMSGDDAKSFHAHSDPGETILRLLAQPYADHPDYRDEWRP